MSRLIDKLKQSAEGPARPLGFRPEPKAATVKPLLVALLSLESGNAAEADALLVQVKGEKLTARKLKDLEKTLDKSIWGVWLEAADDSVARIADSGADFVAFGSPSRLLPLLEAEKLGRVLVIEPGIAESLLHSVDSLDVGAVIVDRTEAGELTWLQVMVLQHAALVIGKPLLAFVSPGIKLEEMKTLWAIGIEGVIVDASQSPEAVGALRTVIDREHWTTRRRRGRMALVPNLPVEAPTPSHAEPEEEPDEDV